MQITHRNIAKLFRLLLISMGVSFIVQVSAIWPRLNLVLYLMIALSGVYFGFFAIRYYGLFSNRRWANFVRIDHLDGGLEEFLTVLFFAGIGFGLTWLIYLT